MHHGFRRDLARFATAVGTVSVGDAGRIRALREHLAFVLDVLHSHHAYEDEQVWPRLRPLVDADERAVLDAMAREHADLDRAVSDAGSAFTVFRAAPNEPGRDALLTALRALTERVEDHLAHEEATAWPLLQRVLPVKAWQECERASERYHKPAAQPKVLPWLLDGVPAATAEKVLTDLPAPVRMLHRQVWTPAHERRASTLWR